MAMLFALVGGFVILDSALLSEAESPGRMGCTALLIQGDAGIGGSSFAGMSADCSNCDGRLAFIPAAIHEEGTRRDVFAFMGFAPRWVGHGRGEFYEPKPGENATHPLGSIPQVPYTYGYWESALPLMNEKGLSFGESSCSAKLVNMPEGQQKDHQVGALLDLSTIMQLAMERCRTALCAVKTMGLLAEEYGFFPMTGEFSVGIGGYDDGGEALTISDASGDAWVFHVVGGLPGREAKSVWAAQRLASGHAAFVANNFIIREVPERPTRDFLYSKDLRGTAQAAGFWHPSDGALDFARVFAPDAMTFRSASGGAPIPLYSSLRTWRLQSLLAPSLKLQLSLDPLKLPFSVRVESRLGHNDVQDLLRDIYSGTEFDLSQGVLAGPFGSPFRLEGGSALHHLGQLPRGISIARTVYGVVGQPRRGEAEPILWYAADAPVTSVFVPFYPVAGDAKCKAYSLGTNREFTRDSSWWAFDFVSNWMQLNYRNMSVEHVYPLIRELQGHIDKGRHDLEARDPSPEALGAWQADIQCQVVSRWWQLADFLVAAYNDGFFNAKVPGASIGYPADFLEAVGLNQDVHPVWVQRAPPKQVTLYPLPSRWNVAENSWSWPLSALPTDRTALEERIPVGAIAAILAVVMAACLGVAAGRRWERTSSMRMSAYSLM
mmetsp:Transcript_20628/g.45186  ORF Transcript_20628/g.45186 Transcript_20628/m.45186 type:complete len:662 (+) Transcript_20628:32-2017(+)